MIKFTIVRFKNFGSFGNVETEIDLDENRMTLVSGSNGNGKSFALLDSITFALFGKPFRKINIPQLPNSINQKNCVVEIEFSIGSSDYRVIRGLSPKKFEIYKNDELLNQDSKAKDYQKMLEDQILKMNYKSFTQVVILGSSSFVPFMQLSAADRRNVIEDILDINIFSGMNSILKGKVSVMKENLRDKTTSVEIEDVKIDKQKNLIESIQSRSDSMVESLQKDIISSDDHLKRLEDDVDQLTECCDSLLTNRKSLDKVRGKMNKLEVLESQIKKNIQKYKNQISFYETETNCPTCKQEISQNVRDETVTKRSSKLDELESALRDLDEKKKETIEELDNAISQNKEVERVQKKISEKHYEINNTRKYVRKVEAQIREIKDGSNSLEKENETLVKHEATKSVMETELEEIKIDMTDYNFIQDLLKDSGIKSKIIKHYLPHTNKLINKYLTAMNFYANFTLDENFNETIKSRHRDDFSYMSFSEGEKMRIDLALLLAWREIAAMKNSVSTNILILDEVFDSSLDSVGTEEFTKLLETLAAKNNIFVISHKSDQMSDKFPNHMRFEKKNNFSRLVKEND
jgi:DNA repair exonuclease SbcCD ATPase subunit